MKLAEALIERADKQKRLAQLQSRLMRNAKVQEGDQPAEDPQTLLAEIDRLVADIETLIKRINKSNQQTQLDDARSLTDALAERDMLQAKHAIYRDLAQQATIGRDRYTRSEIRFESTVDVEAIQAQADDLARAYRLLDTQIQALNWATDLLD